MKILHTSDWHLGAMLYQEKRYDEFDAALEWILKLLQKEAIDILLIAGDVFDTATPSNRAMEQYCQFLSEAVKGGIKQIIITAGNHDSVSFLEAPKQVLRHLNIHVIGKADQEFKDQLIPLKDEKENIQAVICAVPFLRDRDIRQAAAGEDLDTLYQKRYDGVINYYKAICGRASELYPGVPQIVTGHFFAAGGKLSKDHTMGNLFSINVKELPDTISYLALGHLHTPQTVAGKSNFRYSGSLLKMDFGDHDVAKEMLILDTANLSAEPEKIEVPVFQRIENIQGDMEAIAARIAELKKEGLPVWLNVTHTGEFLSNLQYQLNELCKNSKLKVVFNKNAKDNPVLHQQKAVHNKQLSELTPLDVFDSLLRSHDIHDEKQSVLRTLFQEAVTLLNSEDRRAE